MHRGCYVLPFSHKSIQVGRPRDRISDCCLYPCLHCYGFWAFFNLFCSLLSPIKKCTLIKHDLLKRQQKYRRIRPYLLPTVGLWPHLQNAILTSLPRCIISLSHRFHISGSDLLRIHMFFTVIIYKPRLETVCTTFGEMTHFAIPCFFKLQYPVFTEDQYLPLQV